MTPIFDELMAIWPAAARVSQLHSGKAFRMAEAVSHVMQSSVLVPRMMCRWSKGKAVRIALRGLVLKVP